MENILNKKIITAVQKHIPQNQKTVNYLMELLDLSKESSYRRIRGEKGFSAQELYIISRDLNISIDEMLDSGKKERV